MQFHESYEPYDLNVPRIIKALSPLVIEWIYFISMKSTTLTQLKLITPIFKALFYDSHKPYQLNDFNHSLYDVNKCPVSTGHAWRSFKANGLVCLRLYCVNLFVNIFVACKYAPRGYRKSRRVSPLLSSTPLLPSLLVLFPFQTSLNSLNLIFYKEKGCT